MFVWCQQVHAQDWCRRRGHQQFCRRCTTSRPAFHSRWTAAHVASFRENPRMSLDPVFYGISAIHGRIAGSSTPGILESSSRCQLMGQACLVEDLGACAAHFGKFRPIVLRLEVCLLCGWTAVSSAAVLRAFLKFRTPMSTSTRVDSWVGKGPSGDGGSKKRRARPELGLTWTLRVRPRGGLPHHEVGRSPRRTHPTQLGEFSKDSSESKSGGFKV